MSILVCSLSNFLLNEHDDDDTVQFPVSLWLRSYKDSKQNSRINNVWLCLLSQLREMPCMATFRDIRPVWEIIVDNFCMDWGGYKLLTTTPTFYKEVLLFGIQSVSKVDYVYEWVVLYFAHSRGAEYCHQHVCLSVCLAVCLLMHIQGATCPNFMKFSVHVTVAVARPFSCGGMIGRVLPVLWMTPWCLPLIG